MPHAPRTKSLAYQIDPECWISYSGKSVSEKRALEARRNYALDLARRAMATTENAVRRIMQANLMHGHRAAEAEYSKIMKEIEMTDPSLDEVRDAIREVAVTQPLGRDIAAAILHGVGVSRVVDIKPQDLKSVLRVCRSTLRAVETETKLNPQRKTEMPPLKIKMMLHFATVLGPFAPEHTRTSNAYSTFVKELLRDELIERPTKKQRAEYAGWAYKATPRGQCYVKAITEMPLPVRTTPEWTMPSK
jgi:hypothetical protein